METGIASTGIRTDCISANRVHFARVLTALVVIVAVDSITMISIDALASVRTLCVDATRIQAAFFCPICTLVNV